MHLDAKFLQMLQALWMQSMRRYGGAMNLERGGGVITSFVELGTKSSKTNNSNGGSHQFQKQLKLS